MPCARPVCLIGPSRDAQSNVGPCRHVPQAFKGNCMAARPRQTPDTASREATEWLIRLQEEPDDEELRRRFERWRRADSLNEEAWRATASTANLIAHATPAFERKWRPYVEDGPRRRGPGRVASKHRSGRRRQRRRWQVGALALAGCLALLFGPGLVLEMRSDFATATGEVQRIALPDGSAAFLAPESAVALAYDGDARRVDLLAGEAYFEVVPDPSRPFRVMAGEIRTTVLGTEFDVRALGEGTSVAVAEGRVRVDAPASGASPVSEVLTLGQSVRIGADGSVVRGTVRSEQIAAWRRQRLIAQDDPVPAVVDRLRPYYAGTILIADGSLDDRTVTGIYDLSDPVAALRAIAGAHGATMRRVTPWILVVSGF